MHDAAVPDRQRHAPWSRRRAALSVMLVALLCAQLGACAVVDYEQRRWLFQPTKQTWAPGLAAAVGMDEVWIDFVSAHPEQRGEAIRLHGLWLPQAEAAAPVLLFLHGLRWDVRASAPRMRRLHALGFSVLGIDYRGFGRSSDAMPSETLAAEDVRAAWDWLAQSQPQSRRYVFGHSVGAAFAVQLAAAVEDESGVIVEGAFTSSAEHFRSLRWGWLPITGLITQHFDAGSRIARVGSPVLVVHGSDDSMISPLMGRELYERALAPKRFVLVEGGVHEDTDQVGHEQYRQVLWELFGLGRPR
jgi:alpha-beta hydrolase superfamily lysophospholipase